VRCVMHWPDDVTGDLQEMGRDEEAGFIWLRTSRIGIIRGLV
jgi:hypothetical protein